MYRLQGLPYYDFSDKNKYASYYNLAYKGAVDAQNEIEEAQNNPHSTVAEVEKLKQDLKRWEKQAESYSTLAKIEEAKIDQQQENNGKRIDFMA